MQDQERFERLENNIREAAETEAQFDVIRQRLEALDRDSARLLITNAQAACCHPRRSSS